MPAAAHLDPLLSEVDGYRALLLGNEAIARGALEAGLAFFAGYPGTPSSEVTDSLARVAGARGFFFEYAINEKVALEMAFAASLTGARSMCAMKHVGLAYAADPLGTIPYIGTRAGMVIVSAGDPSCATSSNEQDQRWLGPMFHLPVLDPSTPAEALAMSRGAFDLSERSRLPVLLRPTTRVCHTRAVVPLGRLAPARVTGFVRQPARLVPTPENARRLRLEIEQRLDEARAWIADSGFIRRRGSGRMGIVASGAPAATCVELLAERGLEDQVVLVTVGAVHPLPEALLLDVLGGVERVLVVEELSPFLEDAIAALCHRSGRALEIRGKRSGHLPVMFELAAPQIETALRAALGVGGSAPLVPRQPAAGVTAPARPPILCAGCGHRSAYLAARAAFGDDSLFFNDIGCYTLGAGLPLEAADALLSMGSSVSMAAATSRLSGHRTVAFIGDSTFFHSGMPALLDAVKEQASIVVVLLDNQVTAMTGFQESPMVEVRGRALARGVDIAAIVHALGVRHVGKADPWDLPATIAALASARDAKGPAVVVLERACPIHERRVTGTPVAPPFAIAQQRCRSCGRAEHGFRCEVPVTRGFQRHITRTRAVERTRPEPRPNVAPCSAVCPLFLCVQGYSGHVAAGEIDRALEHIVSRVPLPETVCRVCHRPCESACARGAVDAPIAINDLKRYVVEAARDAGIAYAPAREPDSGHRVAVVGAGPSGLAAAHDLRLRGHEVALFDAHPAPGGLLRYGIPAYRLPHEALERDVDRVLSLGVHFFGGRALGRDLHLAQLLASGYDAVYLAVGAGSAASLALPGQGEPGAPIVATALEWLAEASSGTPPATGRKTTVIGGGNAAIDAARAARRGGADVTIVCIESRSEMPALPDEIDAAEAEGVAILPCVRPLALRGGSSPALMVLRLDGGGEEAIAADQVLIAIGQVAALALAAGDVVLVRDDDGSVSIDRASNATSHPRIFAGGDLVAGERTVTGAIAAGQRAAWSIDRTLRGAALADRRLPPPLIGETPIAPWPLVERTDRATRRCAPVAPAAERRERFTEVRGVLSTEDARAEAARCMSCGLCGNCRSCIEVFGCPAFLTDGACIEIDPVLCIGCGVCAELCPDGAIDPVAVISSSAVRASC